MRICAEIPGSIGFRPSNSYFWLLLITVGTARSLEDRYSARASRDSIHLRVIYTQFRQNSEEKQASSRISSQSS